MEQFIIEVPHSPDECMAAASEIMRHSRAAKVAAGTYWGCLQGTHTTWIMAQLDGATEAGELVPDLLRDTARVVRVARGMNPHDVKPEGSET